MHIISIHFLFGPYFYFVNKISCYHVCQLNIFKIGLRNKICREDVQTVISFFSFLTHVRSSHATHGVARFNLLKLKDIFVYEVYDISKCKKKKKKKIHVKNTIFFTIC